MTPSIRGMTPQEIHELLRRPRHVCLPPVRANRWALEPRLSDREQELRFDHDR